MKDLIVKLLNRCVYEGSFMLEVGRFSMVGGCIDVTVPVPGTDLAFKTTFERSDIIAGLYREGQIRGYDDVAKMLLMADDYGTPAMKLEELMDGISDSQKVQLMEMILASTLQGVVAILDAQEDAVDLFQRYWHEYNYLEKQAILWRLSEQGSIGDYHVAQVVQHVLNYLDGFTASLPASMDMNYKLFAVWLKNNHGSLYGLCRAQESANAQNNYTVNMA